MRSPLTSRALNRRMAGAGGMRRPGRGGEGGGAPVDPVDPTLYGVETLTTANFYSTAANAGEAGIAGGFGIAVFYVLTALSAGARFLTAKYSASAGYDFRINVNVLQTFIHNSVPSLVAGPTFTFTAPDVGVVQLSIMQTTGSVLRLYHARAEQGSGVAFTGLTASSAAQVFGKRNDGAGGGTGLAILGGASWHGVPTLAQIQSYYDACMAAYDIVDTIGGATMQHSWSVKRDQAGTAPATITDQVGSDDLTKNGSPTLYQNP